MGRKRNDVFVLGDEQFAEHVGTQEIASERADRTEGPTDEFSASVPSHGGVSSTANLSAARRLAALGLVVGAVAAVAALTLSSGGDHESSRVPEASPSSPVVSAPPPSAPLAAHVPSVSTPRPQPKSKPKHDRPSEPGPRPTTEHERETNDDPAPVSSSVDVPVSVPVPAPVSVPPLPSASPPPGGGDASGGGEEFSFER